MIQLKIEGEGIIIVEGKRPTAICQMVNSQVSIFELDKVSTWHKLLLKDFQKGLFSKTRMIFSKMS